MQFTDGASSEYQVMIEAINGRDVLTVLFETPLEGEERERCEQQLARDLQGEDRLHPRGEGRSHGRAAAQREEVEAHLRLPLLKACKQVERKRSRATCPASLFLIRTSLLGNNVTVQENPEGKST